MAEVYVIGQICSANNFREPNLFIRWNFQAGECPFVGEKVLLGLKLFRIAVENH